jgi:hypothetical protein
MLFFASRFALTRETQYAKSKRPAITETAKTIWKLLSAAPAERFQYLQFAFSFCSLEVHAVRQTLAKCRHAGTPVQ